MNNTKTPWDKRGFAKQIDKYWDNANEVAARQNMIGDLRAQLVSGSILDVGCGTGRIYGELAAANLVQGRSYHGIDTSEAMLKIARQKYPEALFGYGDVLTLNEVADNVLCVQVLQHVELWRSALMNLLAATRKMLYIVTWFGNGNGFRDEYDVWNGWPMITEFNALAQQFGTVEHSAWQDGTCGAVTIHKAEK